MVLRLRLARVSGPTGARRHRAIYNIVLTQARSARDARPMEVLGTYDPIPKEAVGAKPGDRKFKDIKVDVERTKYWIGVGAQPSDTVWRLLSMIGILEPRYLPSGPQSLKAARFETHVPKQKSESTEQTASSSTQHASTILDTIRAQAGSGQREVPASTTSPQDPNAA